MIKDMCSIIIPYYNGEKYIINTVSELLKIDYPSYEILIINDGSTNVASAKSVFETIVKMDTRIQIIHKENGGIADARNYGLLKAKGEYIAFCDQDDIPNAQMYSDLIGLLKSKDVDMVSSNFYTSDKQMQTVVNIIKHNVRLNTEEIMEIRKRLLIGEVIEHTKKEIVVPAVIWNCIFKMSLIQKNKLRFASNIAYEDDYRFILSYLAVCKNIYLTKDAYYTWIIRMDSESHRKKYIPDIIYKYEKHYKYKLLYMEGLQVSEYEKSHFKDYFEANKIANMVYNEAILINNVGSLLKTRKYIKNYLRDNNTFSKYGFLKVKEIKGRRLAIIYWLTLHYCIIAALIIARI